MSPQLSAGRVDLLAAPMLWYACREDAEPCVVVLARPLSPPNAFDFSSADGSPPYGSGMGLVDPGPVSCHVSPQTASVSRRAVA